jgi:uncharacterized protein (UPF0335 family)
MKALLRLSVKALYCASITAVEQLEEVQAARERAEAERKKLKADIAQVCVRIERESLNREP